MGTVMGTVMEAGTVATEEAGAMVDEGWTEFHKPTRPMDMLRPRDAIVVLRSEKSVYIYFLLYNYPELRFLGCRFHLGARFTFNQSRERD